MMTIVRAVPVLALLVLLVAPAPSAAQRGQESTAESREHLERRVRERFEALIRKELGVDDATASRLRTAVEQFSPQRHDLARRQGEVRRVMRHLDALLPPAEAQVILDDLVALQRAELDLIVRERAALMEFLSPGQVLRFYALRDQLNDRVRDARDRDRDRSGGRGGGGGG